MQRPIRFASLVAALAVSVLPLQAAEFVALHDLAPGIAQSMRYATPLNFTGAPVPGYETGTCILTRPTAEALLAVQQRLAASGLGLVVFDCYRPEKAVAAFVAWARRKGVDEESAKQFHAPNVPAGKLFSQGYIAERSGHSRGHTVDLGLIKLGAALPAVESLPDAGDCTTKTWPGDALLDMGTSFDCLDRKSGTGAKGLTREQRDNRKLLRSEMIRAGFRPYDKEWWHFSFPPGDAGKPYDFPVNPAAMPAE